MTTLTIDRPTSQADEPPCPNPDWCTGHDSGYSPRLPAGLCFSTPIHQGPITASLGCDERGVTVSLGITENDATGCDGGQVDLTVTAAEDLIRVLTELVLTAKGQNA